MGASSESVRLYFRLQQKMKKCDDETVVYRMQKKLERLREGFPVWIEHPGWNLATADMSVVLCIGGDSRMNAGVAKDVCDAFPANRRFLSGESRRGRGLRVGQVVPVTKQLSTRTGLKGAQYIFNLVTKRRHHDRATYRGLELALRNLLRQVRERRITKLALPMLGCGRDRLSWHRVRNLIEKVFCQYPIRLHLCLLDD
ncbi:ADP-ribose glycohydrolase OARD1-like [Cloeon dipterum]|uniref:ADP-ribose glycohydrolase OARD1-like n=1 Tax=Cloeon dipterum TaxID=197152 RepID=UPI0032202965